MALGAKSPASAVIPMVRKMNVESMTILEMVYDDGDQSFCI